jgi:hypothetical protein
MDFEKLAVEITRENWAEMLNSVSCPYCGAIGEYTTFVHPNNNGMGIVCGACGRRHPFMGYGIHWLRGGEKRRRPPNNIAAVIAECGDYCFICGATGTELKAWSIGITVFHTRPWAVYGDDFKKIPVCVECHELATGLQRGRQRRRDADARSSAA